MALVLVDILYFCTLVDKMLASFYNQHLVHIRGAFSHRHAYHVGYLLSSGKLRRHNGKAVGVEKNLPGNFLSGGKKKEKAYRFLKSHSVSWHKKDNPGNVM